MITPEQTPEMKEFIFIPPDSTKELSDFIDTKNIEISALQLENDEYSLRIQVLSEEVNLIQLENEFELNPNLEKDLNVLQTEINELRTKFNNNQSKINLKKQVINQSKQTLTELNTESYKYQLSVYLESNKDAVAKIHKDVEKRAKLLCSVIEEEVNLVRIIEQQRDSYCKIIGINDRHPIKYEYLEINGMLMASQKLLTQIEKFSEHIDHVSNNSPAFNPEKRIKEEAKEDRYVDGLKFAPSVSAERYSG